MRFVLALAAWLALAPALAAPEPGDPAPDFTHDAPRDWLNTEPLTLADLRGRVVLVDFWTFMCWNCYRSFPWLTALEDRLAGEPFTVVGVHAPEFDAERDRARVEASTRKFGLHHPVMIDNDFSYWRVMGNRYWPAWYLIDKRGRLRARFIGETHEGDPQAREIEAAARRLLAE